MKLFDLHGDIGYAVNNQHKLGNFNSLRTIQYPKRKKGEFEWICMASYFEKEETWKQMQDMITGLHEEIQQNNDIFTLCKTRHDLDKKGIKAILTVEGMCAIKSNIIEKIQWLKDRDIHIASLTWNYQTALASGAMCSIDYGLSDLGKIAIKQMQQKKIIVDLAHASKQTFWDVSNLIQEPFLVTHANCNHLCNHPRNLDDEQLQCIKANHGLIGVCAAKAFLSRDKHITCNQLVEHIIYIIHKIGIEYVALGLDFMDDFEQGTQYMVEDLQSPDVAQNIIQTMINYGFHKHEIEKIAYKNMYHFLQKNMRSEI